jgi:hypothetical protein
MRSQILTVMNMKITVFLDVALCSLLETEWCLEGATITMAMTQFLPDHKVQNPRRQNSSAPKDETFDYLWPLNSCLWSIFFSCKTHQNTQDANFIMYYSRNKCYPEHKNYALFQYKQLERLYINCFLTKR